MRALAVHGAHDLRLDERPRPSPGPEEALIAVEWGGICGSDLAYAASGASGTAELRHPLVLGHEIAGRVVELGDQAPDHLLNARVTVMPASLPEGTILDGEWTGRSNLHPDVRYLGSAAHYPHTDGGFRELLPVRTDQIHRLPETVDTRRGALAEPLAVALHAVHRAEGVAKELLSGSVLVNGCGPIGLLIIAILKHRGHPAVTAADISEPQRDLALRMGADHAVDLSRKSLASEAPVTFEASGAASALGAALRSTARSGVLVQVGNLPKTPVPAALGDLISKEITWIGSFRFYDEMPGAVQLLAEGLDTTPVMTHSFAFDEALEAFRTAASRSEASSKVMLRIGDGAG